jgi:hypothetical protein
MSIATIHSLFQKYQVSKDANVINDVSLHSGKISNLSVTPESGEADAPRSATVTFEKETYVYSFLAEQN